MRPKRFILALGLLLLCACGDGAPRPTAADPKPAAATPRVGATFASLQNASGYLKVVADGDTYDSTTKTITRTIGNVYPVVDNDLEEFGCTTAAGWIVWFDKDTTGEVKVSQSGDNLKIYSAAGFEASGTEYRKAGQASKIKVEGANCTPAKNEYVCEGCQMDIKAQ